VSHTTTRSRARRSSDRQILARFSIGLLVGVLGCGNGHSDNAGVTSRPAEGADKIAASRAPTCTAATSAGAVAKPSFKQHLDGETGWFASPLIVDLDGDGSNELIAAYYDVFVFDVTGKQLARIDAGGMRVYAPHVVADLDADGTMEIVFGAGSNVHAYEWIGQKAVKKAGWPALADSLPADGNDPEVRGLAAADLDGDGKIEVVATTTETTEAEKGGAQVFVFDATGALYQPAGLGVAAWPRYNSKTGSGNDADRNGYGHHGYGCYGLNVGIGNVDDDAELEILATYDNHHIQAFDPNGVAINASSYFTNRANDFEGQRFTYGQFIRWADPKTEEQHYHLHQGNWPDINVTEWLQWTQSPPSVADLDGDGRAEIIGVPNVELHEPYQTQAWAIMVLEGAHGDGERAAMRKPGWETLPRGLGVLNIDGWYPPTGVPAPAIVNLLGDSKLEIVVSLNDYRMHAFDASGVELWRYNYSQGRAVAFASEPTIADLNQDGSPEVLFATFGAPDVPDSGNLVVLGADGAPLFVVPLPKPGSNGNGNGAPAAPTVADWDGDGTLEIFVQTFDHGLDVFTAAGSAGNCLLWSTARGGPLRTGAANGSGQ
jgi:hypothetical protein